jgi:hypothetical protein
MSKFLHGPPKFSRGPSVVREPPVGDRCPRRYESNHKSVPTDNVTGNTSGKNFFVSKYFSINYSIIVLQIDGM